MRQTHRDFVRDSTYAATSAVMQDQEYDILQRDRLEAKEERLREAFIEGVKLPSTLLIGNVDGLMLDVQ